MMQARPMITRNRLRPMGLACLALLAGLSVGCAAHREPETAPSLAGSRDNGVVRLTRQDHNRTAELRTGERLVLSLPEAQGGSRTWAIEETDRRLLMLEDSHYQPSDQTGFIGVRGERIFQFKAQQPGELTLALRYWRFFEGEGSVTDRYSIHLRILP